MVLTKKQKTSKQAASIPLLSSLFLGFAGSASAAINVDVTYDNPSATTLTVELSGSQEVTSTDGNNEWDTSAATADIWRTLNVESGASNLLDLTGFNLNEYTVTSGDASASVASGDSVALDTVSFFTDTSDGRNDFSIGFAENPSPAFGVGETVTFSGTATVDLGSDTASIFNSGEWSETNPPGVSFVTQFDTLDLQTLSVSQVPEPSIYGGVLGLMAIIFTVARRPRK